MHFSVYLFPSVTHMHRCYYNMFVIENGTDADLQFAQQFCLSYSMISVII